MINQLKLILWRVWSARYGVGMPVAGLIISIASTAVQADTVQRWKDQQGQWHYGDSTSSHGHRAQPVFIDNPISIVRNEQPQSATPSVARQGSRQQPDDRPPSARKSSRTASKTARNPSLAGNDCDTQREQLYQLPLRPAGSRDGNQRQQQQRQYEQHCIIGRYYGH